MLELTQIQILNPRGIGAILLLLLAIIALGYAFTHAGKGIFLGVLLLAGVGTLGYFEYQYQSAQAEGSAAIQKVYQNPQLSLHCQRFSESLTDTVASGDRYEAAHPGTAWVPQQACSDFLSWVQSDHSTATTAQATGIYEVAAATARVSHISDVCVPVTAMSPLAQAVGATPAAASALESDYYINVWSKTAGNPGCSIV